jgi:hypothetical protein
MVGFMAFEKGILSAQDFIRILVLIFKENNVVRGVYYPIVVDCIHKKSVFQQDGAASHTSKVTQSFLEEATPHFIKKDEWLPQSPDSNPMDYTIWDSLSETEVYSGRMEAFTENELKDKIREKWEEITLEEIRK